MYAVRVGERANYVLIDGGKAKVFHAQWGARDCLLRLAEGAEGLKRSVPEGAREETTLMDGVWAEGGILIDYDARVCVAFGEVDVEFDEMPEESRDALRDSCAAIELGWSMYVEHIAEGWRGFTMVRDARGVDAFAEHLRRRGITSIHTWPASHPADVPPPESVVVPAAG